MLDPTTITDFAHVEGDTRVNETDGVTEFYDEVRLPGFPGWHPVVNFRKVNLAAILAVSDEEILPDARAFDDATANWYQRNLANDTWNRISPVREADLAALDAIDDGLIGPESIGRADDTGLWFERNVANTDWRPLAGGITFLGVLTDRPALPTGIPAYFYWKSSGGGSGNDHLWLGFNGPGSEDVYVDMQGTTALSGGTPT